MNYKSAVQQRTLFSSHTSWVIDCFKISCMQIDPYLFFDHRRCMCTIHQFTLGATL